MLILSIKKPVYRNNLNNVEQLSGYHGLPRLTHNINHHTPPSQAMEISRAGKGYGAWWAGGRLGQCLCELGKKLRPTGGVGACCWGQVHSEAMCSFSEPRPGGKGHLDPNNVGFLCSREAGSHLRTEHWQPSEPVRRELVEGWGWECSFPLQQVTDGPLYTMGLSVPS